MMASPNKSITLLNGEIAELNISPPTAYKRKRSKEKYRVRDGSEEASKEAERPSRSYARGRRYENDMDDLTLDFQCDRLFNSLLRMSVSEVNVLERQTVGQSANCRWESKRGRRLSAEHFDRVVKLRDTTYRSFLVEEMLWSTAKSRYLNAAILAYQQHKKQNVEPCGLFVHPECGYLCASPDGLIGKDGILFIDCPHVSPRSPRARSSCNRLKMRLNEDGPKLVRGLSRKHNYFYQIQGQLEITGRYFCDFVIWKVDGGIAHVERIYRETSVWMEMFPKLETFYKLSLLPELVDSRYARGLPIRELDLVLDAVEKERKTYKKGF